MSRKPTREDLEKKIESLESALDQSRQREQALQKSEHLLRQIIDVLPDGMFAIDLEGRVTIWNQAMEDVTGIKTEDILGKGDYEYALAFYGERRPITIDLVYDWNEEVEKKYVFVKRQGDMLVSETRNPPFLKKPAHFWNSARPLRDASGEVSGAIEVIRDITELKQVHEELEARAQLLRIYVEHTPTPVAMCDLNMCYLAVSRRWIDDYGLPEKDLIGKCHYDLMPEIPERWKEEHKRVFAGQSLRIPAELFPRADGSNVWLKRELVPWRDAKGDIGGLIIFNEMITERKKAEDALSAEKERLAVTLRSIGDAVISTDRQGIITLMNPVAESLTGWSEAEAMGQPLDKVFRIVQQVNRGPCGDPVQQVLEQGAVVGLQSDTLLIGSDDSEYIIDNSGAPIRNADGRIIGVVLVFRDITQERRTENELMRMEKLESLGVLAGGIAHDFNNFLTGIIGNISIARLDVGPNEKLFTQLNQMEKAAMRARELTQQLLTFSKGGAPVRRPVRMAHVAQESAQLALRGAKVRCEFDFSSEQLTAEVDEGQINQAFYNLVLNANQAMPDGGVIHIIGDEIELLADNVLSLPAGSFVRLRFKDRGVGIKREHLKNVFDPYFTTKDTGNGLGLAVVYSVIDKHRGRITVDSEPGQGTEFTVYLPAIPQAADECPQNDQQVFIGSGRILIMDDEDYISTVVLEMLELLGYEGTAVTNGAEAIEVYRQSRADGRPFDAVILDLTVPGGMGGKETIQKLLEIDPDVKAIVSSGYSNDPVLSDYKGYGFKLAVDKPYRIQDLSAALQKLLKGSHQDTCHCR